MNTTVRTVREIPGADRQAIERLLGHSLGDSQQVVIAVAESEIPSGEVPPTGSEEISGEVAVPEWWKVYEGLSADEVDCLDAAIRRRADLSRAVD